MLIRRNTENLHSFSEEINKKLDIFDMQGLLLNKDEAFTAAIEAFEYSDRTQATSICQDAFETVEDLYVRSCFAEAVGVPFYVLLHKQRGSQVTFYQVSPDREKQQPVCVERFRLTEGEFIQWWRKNKQTEQTKEYRRDFRNRIRESYYDETLESNGLKWGGNIDGYFVDRNAEERKIGGIIEKRYTNKKSIEEYDPADYFFCGGGDYHTWKPLFLLKEQMYQGKEDIPIFLFTHSNQEGEERKVGVTIVDKLTPEGIEYIKDETGEPIRPNQMICDSVQELKEKIKYLWDRHAR